MWSAFGRACCRCPRVTAGDHKRKAAVCLCHHQAADTTGQSSILRRPWVVWTWLVRSLPNKQPQSVDCRVGCQRQGAGCEDLLWPSLGHQLATQVELREESSRALLNPYKWQRFGVSCLTSHTRWGSVS